MTEALANLFDGKSIRALERAGEPRISWRESILYASGLKRRVSEDQMEIPARAGSGY